MSASMADEDPLDWTDEELLREGFSPRYVAELGEMEAAARAFVAAKPAGTRYEFQSFPARHFFTGNLEWAERAWLGINAPAKGILDAMEAANAGRASIYQAFLVLRRIGLYPSREN